MLGYLPMFLFLVAWSLLMLWIGAKFFGDEHWTVTWQDEGEAD